MTHPKCCDIIGVNAAVRRYHASVLAHNDPPLVEVLINSTFQKIPYIVEGYCENFDSYWDMWCDQHGPVVNLRDLDILDGEHLETVLLECYNFYCAETFAGCDHVRSDCEPKSRN